MMSMIYVMQFAATKSFQPIDNPKELIAEARESFSQLNYLNSLYLFRRSLDFIDMALRNLKYLKFEPMRKM
jgi:hypothetical protein